MARYPWPQAEYTCLELVEDDLASCIVYPRGKINMKLYLESVLALCFFEEFWGHRSISLEKVRSSRARLTLAESLRVAAWLPLFPRVDIHYLRAVR